MAIVRDSVLAEMLGDFEHEAVFTVLRLESVQDRRQDGRRRNLTSMTAPITCVM